MAVTHRSVSRRVAALVVGAAVSVGAAACAGDDEPVHRAFDALCPTAQAALDALASASDPTDAAVIDAFAAVGASAAPEPGSPVGAPDQLVFGLEQMHQSYVAVHSWHTSPLDGRMGDVFGPSGSVLDASGTLARLDEACRRVEVDGFEWRGAPDLAPLPEAPAQLVRFLGVRMVCGPGQPAECEPAADESDEAGELGRVWCAGVGGSFRCAPFDPQRYFGLGLAGVNHVCVDMAGSASEPSGDYRCAPWTAGPPPDPAEIAGALVCDGLPDGAAETGTDGADGLTGGGPVWPPAVC